MQHSNYWSCSAFADWIRGNDKPLVGTSKEWYQWEKATKETHPFRYWIAEEFLDGAQNFFTFPISKLYDVKYYVNNRWVTKTNSLTAHPSNIKPGKWCDVGNRFLPCLFNELVNFVEIESAWSHIAWGSEKDRLKYNAPFWATGWFRWRTWRSPEAGIDHLKWASALTGNDYLPEDSPDRDKPTPQALSAREILELYTWWTTTYRNRPEPYEASGWSELCDRRLITHADDGILWEDRSEEEKGETTAALELSHKIEAEYDEEDEQMMVRLIKVRNSLWT